MKKWLALLFAMMLLCTVAIAEELPAFSEMPEAEEEVFFEEEAEEEELFEEEEIFEEEYPVEETEASEALVPEEEEQAVLDATPGFAGYVPSYQVLEDGTTVYLGEQYIETSSELERASLPKLPKATNAHWGKKGLMEFTVPDTNQGELRIAWYDNDTQKEVDSVRWSYDTFYEKNLSHYDFRLDSEHYPSGKYYFTVTMLGDGIKYADSDPVKSDIYNYVKPSSKLKTPTKLWWSKDEYEFYGNAQVEEAGAVGGYEFRFYFTPSQDKEPKIVGGMFSYSEQWGEAIGDEVRGELYDLPLSYGKGYYFFKVKFLSGDIEKRQNSALSAMSPAFDGETIVQTVTDLLEEAANLNDPDDIRDSVQQIDTAELKASMLQDSEVLNQLSELEDRVGGPAPVMSDREDFPASEVSIVGANLNTPDGGEIRLNIGRAENEDIVPAMYDNALAVRFSMNLDNVADPEHLDVPVMIELPVPESINPDFLVVLHYHAATGVPETIFPILRYEGGNCYASFVLTSFSDFVMTEVVHDMEMTDYLLVENGSSVRLSCATSSEKVEWSVSDGGVASISKPVTADGVSTVSVTGKAQGTTYVAVTADFEGIRVSKRTRIDVLPAGVSVDDGVSFASLVNKTATVNLYSTDYAKVQVLLGIAQNQRTVVSKAAAPAPLLPENMIAQPIDNGAAIDSASFIDAKAADVFDLVVKDDRTLCVVPKYEKLVENRTNAKAVASSYTSAILVTVGKQQFVTEPLKLSVKKTAPAVKAGAVKINSAFAENDMLLTFTGGEVIAIEPDASKNTSKVSAVPDWMHVDFENMTVGVDRFAKKTGTLYLLATVRDCAVKVPLAVKVTAASTQAKITFAPAIVTLLPNTQDEVRVTAKITPAEFASVPLEFVRVEEIIGKEKRVCGDDEVICAESEGIIRVYAHNQDGLAHTYKVYYMVNDAEYAFTVKTLAKGTAVTATVKAAGAIDTAIEGSAITLTPTFKNYHANSGEDYSVKVERQNTKTKEVEDATDLFYDEMRNGVLTITENIPGTIEKGYTYTAIVGADLDVDGEDDVFAKAKLTIKWSDPEKVKPGVTIKATGSIDVLRPDTRVTVVPTIKNGFIYDISEENVCFYAASGKEKVELTEHPFDVDTENGAYVITVAEPDKVNHTVKYFVGVKLVVNGQEVVSPQIALPVKMGTAKVAADVKEVTLLAKDAFSTSNVKISLSDATLYEFEDQKVRIVDANSPFSIEVLGGGEYAVGFAGQSVPSTFKAGQSKTMKLGVFLTGNNTDKPNATISLKVNIR